MDNIQLYKEIYTHELSRKKDLNNAISTPLTIIVLLFCATFYLYNNLEIIIIIPILHFFHGILILALVTLVCSILCLTICFNIVLKGFRYPNFPYANEISEYEEKCKPHEGEFNKYLTNKYIYYADAYQKINDKRASALYYGRVFIVISLFLIIVAGCLFLLSKT